MAYPKSSKLSLHVEDTGIEIGRSARSVVFKVKYMGLECAAKAIFAPEVIDSPELLSSSETESEDSSGGVDAQANAIASSSHTLVNHCRLLARLRHPNVVQFLGLCDLPGRSLPAIVSEYLPSSLAQTLDRYGTLPDEIAYPILRDSALGLCYLHGHSPRLCHGRLTAKNVLLTSDLTAKIGDVGCSSALIVNHYANDPSECYFPHDFHRGPNALNASLDMFSFGVLTVHMLCGEWPTPTVVVKLSEDLHESTRHLSASRMQLEIESRAIYLKKISDKHPMKSPIILCLSMFSTMQPEAQDVLKVLNEQVAQHPATYSNKLDMMRQLKSLEEEFQAQKVELSKRSPPNRTLSRGESIQQMFVELEHIRSKAAKLSVENSALRVIIRSRENSPTIAVRNGELPCNAEMQSGSGLKYDLGQVIMTADYHVNVESEQTPLHKV